jgi:hypothetical protein
MFDPSRRQALDSFFAAQPGPYVEPTLTTMLDQVIAWSAALAPLRAPRAATEAA